MAPPLVASLPSRSRSGLQMKLSKLCHTLSGAVALMVLSYGEYLGELGLHQLEDCYSEFETLEISHNLRRGSVLAACHVAVERLLVRSVSFADNFIKQLATKGVLDESDIRHLFSPVRPDRFGLTAEAALYAPWIDDEIDRVHRLYIGS